MKLRWESPNLEAHALNAMDDIHGAAARVGTAADAATRTMVAISAVSVVALLVATLALAAARRPR